MTEKPALDPELHEDDTVVSVWKRRMILVLLIILVVAVSAPAFSGCGGALASKKTAATFEIAGRTIDVTDEDLGKFMRDFTAMKRATAMSPNQRAPLPEGEEGVKTALSLMMLDAAAKAQSIDVPDALLAERIHAMPMFQVGGKFDESRYRGYLAEFGLNHESFSAAMRMEMRVAEYYGIYGTALEMLPSDEAYDAWRKRNVKVTALYVASPYAVQRAKFADQHPSEEEVTAIEHLPEVQKILAKPPSKTVSVAYCKVADMSDEQFAAAKKFAADADLFSEDSPLEDEAKKIFHFAKDTVFTKDHWVALYHPEYAAAKAAADKVHDAWAALPKEEREKQKEPSSPPDPAQTYSAEERAQYLLWQDRATKEALARELVRKFAADADRATKSFDDFAADYAKYGVKVVRNPEPLPDKELVEKFPDPVARDSEFGQVALNEFRALPEGQLFKRKYHDQPVPTTQLADRMNDRGFMTMCLEQCDPARKYTVAEKPAEILEFWRKHKIAESAKAVLTDVKKTAEAAGPDAQKVADAAREAAGKAGLAVETIRRFNRKTETPKPPTAAPGQKLPPDLEATARALALRNRVQQAYTQLSALEPGKFLDVIVDEKDETALLVLVVEKQDPAPVEMLDDELRAERYGAMMQAQSKMNELAGFDALAKRFDLKRFDEKKSEAKPKSP